MSTNTIQDEIIDEFSFLEGWDDKYAYIIDSGKALPAIPDEYKVVNNLIKGCQSQVWIYPQINNNGNVELLADSDALIVKGLIALLLRVLNNQTPSDILNTDLYFIDSIEMRQHLSPTRANGLNAMIKQIKYFALALQSQNK